MILRRYGIAALVFSLIGLTGAYGIDFIDETATFYSPQDGIQELTVRLRFTTLMGEPVINGTYTWIATPGYEETLPSRTECVIDLEFGGGVNGGAYIVISPTVPRSGETGFNTPGSPDWSKVFFLSFQGTSYSNWVPREDAIRIVKHGTARIIGAALVW